MKFYRSGLLKMVFIAGLCLVIGTAMLNAQERAQTSANEEKVTSSISDRTARYVLGGLAVFVIGIFSCFFLCKKTDDMRHREKIYRAILRALPDLALVLDDKGQHIEILTPQTDSDGKAKRNLISRFLPSEHFANLMKSARLAMETGKVQNLNFQTPLTTGKTWFDIHIAPLENKPKKSRSTLVLIRDTTPQKQADASSRSTEKEVQKLTAECEFTRQTLEETILEIKERFRAMVENATDCFMIIDKDMRIAYISPSVANVTGHAIDDLLGMRFAINIHPDDQNKVYDLYARTLKKTSTSMPFTCQVKHQDGSWHVIEAVMNNMEDNPAVCGIVVNFRDVTEQHLLERQFQQVQKMETMGQLAGGVAHDFNNCLQSIQGLVELLIPKTPAGTPQEEDLQAIKHASQQAASVTRQLLAFSQRQTFEAHILDLNTVVHDQQKMLARLIGENISLEFRPEPLLWPICADVGQLQQVIMNLIVNARDAMPLGGHILITTANTTYSDHDILPGYNMRAGRFVRLSISDSGNGMSPDVLAHIFEPFFTTKESDKGTGLGLSVVHGIVKQHDGWIHVYSTPGNGSEFKIYLPIGTPSDFAPKTERRCDLPKGSGQCILLVEDDPATRIVTSRNLISQGYTVRMVTTVTEARSLFIRVNKEIDLLLCDVVLPDGNGVDLTHELLILKPDIQIIMMSGYADDKARWHEIAGQGWNFLQKPYAFDELLRLIDHCLSSKQSSPKMREQES